MATSRTATTKPKDNKDTVNRDSETKAKAKPKATSKPKTAPKLKVETPTHDEAGNVLGPKRAL